MMKKILDEAKGFASTIIQPYDSEDSGWWRKYGPKFNEAVDKIYDGYKEFFDTEVTPYTGLQWHQVDLKYLKKVAADALKQWDNEFCWDAPRMNESTEDAFYEFIASARIDERHSG